MSTLIDRIATMSQGRRPVWAVQASEVDAPNSPPSGATAGVATNDAVVTSLVVEQESAGATTVRIWLLPRERETWVAANDCSFDLTASWTERIITAGFSRVYIEVVSTDVDVTLVVGPCTSETT